MKRNILKYLETLSVNKQVKIKKICESTLN